MRPATEGKVEEENQVRRKKEKGQEAGETGRQSLRCNAVSPSVMCGEEEGSMCRSAVQRSEAQFGSVQIHFSFWPWLWLWLRLSSDHSRPAPLQPSAAQPRHGGEDGRRGTREG